VGRSLRTSLHTWSESWYSAYGLTGMIKSALALMLVPLIIRHSGSATEIGVVVGAFYLGGLTAPLWGELADRYRLHRLLFAGGMALSGLALTFFAGAEGVLLWALSMFLANTGATMASTMASLFVVQMHPQEEWTERIGWLQTFYGGGQVLGLLLAAAVTARTSVDDYRLGLAAGGLIVLAGAIPGWLRTRTPPENERDRPSLVVAPRSLDHDSGAPVHSYYLTHLAGRRALGGLFTPQFALLLLVLLLASGAVVMFYALYPVVMDELYGVKPSLTSLAYAFAATLNLTLYAPAGVWSNRFGQLRLLRIGLVVRSISFGLLFLITLDHGADPDWLALPLFVMISLAFPLISVASTALTAALAPAGRGRALGLNNSATAAASAVGSVASGLLADKFGFAAVPLAAGIVLLAALTLSVWLQAPATQRRSVPA